MPLNLIIYFLSSLLERVPENPADVPACYPVLIPAASGQFSRQQAAGRRGNSKSEIPSACGGPYKFKNQRAKGGFWD
jgi:hypothetical protein